MLFLVLPGACWFQSTPPRGRRLSRYFSTSFISWFQSTPPRGRRPARPPRLDYFPILFQSTPPRGRRPPTGKVIFIYRIVSIHASAREATVCERHFERVALFQSTPPRGRRLCCWLVLGFIMWFQSTPPRGRRPASTLLSGKDFMFQSTPPRGRRP